MSKQQLIDKAIDDLKGNLPWGTNEACVLVYYPRPSSYAMSHPICIHSGAYEICTRQEFEARKAEREKQQPCVDKVEQARKELGFENTPIIHQWQLDKISTKIDEIESRKQEQHWYDYENQKALRFPPVGTVCLVNEYDKVEIVGETKDGYKVFKHVDTGFFGMAYQLTSYKPVDWDGGLKSIINNYLDIEDYQINGLVQAILAAGYRKCDNKTSTTQE